MYIMKNNNIYIQWRHLGHLPHTKIYVEPIDFADLIDLILLGLQG